MNTILSNFHFIRPFAFVLLPASIVLWWLLLKREDALRGWRIQIDSKLLSAISTGRQRDSFSQTNWMFVAWTIAIIAIAGPTWQIEPSPFADDATPLIILLKADVSMETTDLAPTRLERAKLKIADLAEARKGQPLGLIAYSGSAHLVLPPTRDTTIVSQMANEISPEIMPEAGDRLDLALHETTRVLKNGGQGGSILVIADSVDTAPDSIKSVLTEHPFSIQFLEVNTDPNGGTIGKVAKQIGAKVNQITVDSTDISNVISIASRAPQTANGTDGERWQEAGYWLVPIIVFLMLATFRKEERADEGEVLS